MRTVQGRVIKDFKFHHPASIMISGSTGTGKTHMTENLIKKNMFTKKIKNIFYYGAHGNCTLEWDQELPQEVQVRLLEGLPTTKDLLTLPKRSLVIIDDQFSEAIESEAVARAFKVDRRNQKFSLVLITQNVFEKGKHAKTIRNNTEVFILFKNYGDREQNKRLAKQLGLKRRYETCLKDFTRTPDDKHSYCILNAQLNCPDDDLRCVTGIFCEFSNIQPAFHPICYTE
jgi:DNA replication protein DnaC